MKKWLLVVAAACFAACGDADVPVDSRKLVGSDETVEFSALQLPEQARLSVGSLVNLRVAPSREASVLMVVPADAEVTLLRNGAEQGLYKVSFHGHEGWAYGAYLRQTGEAEFAQSTHALTQTETDAIMARAKAALGYSYWWGHAIWGCGIDKGSCSSSSHFGAGGTDNPGLVNKSWHVPPSANPSTCVDGYVYSTTSFYNYRYHWTQVSRATLRPADALVTSQGHIFLAVSGDGWGSMQVIECGCTSGCLSRLRTASSDYIAIRRNTGWL